MKDLQLFNLDDIQVRYFTESSDIWFLAKDITDALEYKNGRDAISRHCKKRGVVYHDTYSNGRTQSMAYINESNFYKLVLKSQLPVADRLEDLVTEKILPSIRKTGSYSVEKVNTEVNVIDLLETTLIRLKSQEVTINIQETKIKKLEPKAQGYDIACSSKSLIDMGDLAQNLAFKSVGRNNLYKILRDSKILHNPGKKRNRPYQRYVEQGLFKLTPVHYPHPRTGDMMEDFKTEVTAKGRDYIIKLLIRLGYQQIQKSA